MILVTDATGVIGRALHGLTALAVVILSALQLLLAILVRHPEGGSPRLILTGTFMIVLSLAVLLAQVWSRSASGRHHLTAVARER
ncbi:hypothetical protein [Nonomuraea turcica]|uniref:hypothetical protein n=1 Tax=Nonomuraea sp. G32 TaxID=3067274 RepID=UPI00273B925E|nr:hypothetical protein [Nonomuraea sp. G32]MDP4511524.1 hypothetical protein [Nonomuraea sp. G32]